MATGTEVRKKIRCCKCGKVFSLIIDMAGEPEIYVTCLYCSAPLLINLAKYPKTESEIMRATGDDAPKNVTVYVLPEVLGASERVV